MEYVVTPNDAKDLSSVTTVTSVKDPSLTVTMPTLTGGGTLDANKSVAGALYYSSADVWQTEVTLSYSLGGEAKTLKVSQVEPPEFQGLLWIYGYNQENGGPMNDKEVTTSLHFLYPTEDRHSYELHFTGVSIGWSKKVPLNDGVYTFEPVGDTRQIWDGRGASPITGPTGPAPDGNNLALTYTYNGKIDTTPSAAAAAAGATHYYLIFSLEGTGTDSLDGAVYRINYPTDAQSDHVELTAGTLESPAVSISHVWYWGEVNTPGGLNHAEVEYVIVPNDADPGSIHSTATITSTYDPSWTVSKTMSGSGTLDANMSTRGAGFILFPSSAAQWITKVEVSYTLGGKPGTVTATVTDYPKLWGAGIWAEYLMHSGPVNNMSANYEISFSHYTADRMTYSFDFIKATLVWLDDGDNVVGSKVIWNGGSDSPYYGPYPYVDGEYDVLGYSFWDDDIDATPPDPAATRFQLIFTAAADATDTDGSVYTFYGGDLQFYTLPLPLP